MVGPGGVGKSSFLRGLMSQRLVRHAESTILADTKTVKPQLWVKAGESADSYWAEVSDQDEIEELAGLLHLVTQAKFHPSNPPHGATFRETTAVAAAVGEFNPRGYKPQSVQTISDKYVSSIKDKEVQNVLQQVAQHTQSLAPQSNPPRGATVLENTVAAAAVGEFNPQGYTPQSVQTISDEYVSYVKDNEVRNVLQQVARHAISHSQ